MEQENKRTAGRPRGIFKWKINGKPVKAEEFYHYRRELKKIKENEKYFPENLELLAELTKLRDLIEVLIKKEMLKQANLR